METLGPVRDDPSPQELWEEWSQLGSLEVKVRPVILDGKLKVSSGQRVLGCSIDFVTEGL